jgi:hypothetical protein
MSTDKHPLQAYIYRNKDRVKFLCDTLGVSEGTLRQLPYKTRLNVTKAFAMEIATGGRVPAESVSDQAELTLELADQIVASRATAAALNWHAADDDQTEIDMDG